MSEAIISFPVFGEKFQLYPIRYFELFGRYFYIYGIIVALGFLAAFGYAMYRRKTFGLSQDNIFDMLLCCIIGGVVGARLYYVAFNLEYYLQDPIQILYVWNGGLAIYGGIIGGVIAMAIYCKKMKVSLFAMLDSCSLALLIGQAIGRWGNFVNREAYGASTSVPWKMGLTSITTGQTIYVHPTFLYESVWNVIGFFLLSRFAKKHRKYDGQIILMYLVWYGLGRFMIEGLRADSLYIGSSAIRVSQLVAAISFTAALVVLILLDRKKHDPALMYVNKASAPAAEAAEEAAAEISETVSEESKEETNEISADSEDASDPTAE